VTVAVACHTNMVHADQKSACLAATLLQVIDPAQKSRLVLRTSGGCTGHVRRPKRARIHAGMSRDALKVLGYCK